MKKREDGFTLIEVILTIVIAGILGSMLAGYMGTGLLRSSESINNINNALAFQKVMEKITADSNLPATTLNIINDNVSHNNDADVTSCADPAYCSNLYGTYKLIEHTFIEFVGGSEVGVDTTAGNPCEILKVTIAGSSGERLSSLFVETGNVCP